jgi:hypothetical protein
MTQVIVLYSKNLSDSPLFVERANATEQKKIWHCLSERQQQFVRAHTWRTELNWRTGESELIIRKSQFSTKDWTTILFLFPCAHLRGVPLQ